MPPPPKSSAAEAGEVEPAAKKEKKKKNKHHDTEPVPAVEHVKVSTLPAEPILASYDLDAPAERKPEKPPKEKKAREIAPSTNPDGSAKDLSQMTKRERILEDKQAFRREKRQKARHNKREKQRLMAVVCRYCCSACVRFVIYDNIRSALHVASVVTM